MAKKFLTNIDGAQNQLQNWVIHQLAGAPGSPVEGQAYWSTTSHRPLFYNANTSAWENYATNSDNLGGQAGSYYLSRANHTGTQTASTISDLATVVKAYTLDSFAQPVAAVNMGGQRVTNAATPTTGSDLATKAYVDGLIQGVTTKPTAMVATTANLSATYANGTSGVGATLTATSNGAFVHDGYTGQLNDVVLVLNQSTAYQNGLYTLTTVGNGSTPWVLTRHVDMDQSAEFGGGLCAVEANNTTASYKNSLWLCSANSPTVGTTSISFTQLNSATSYTAGNGINIAGNAISAVGTTGITVGGSGIGVDFTVVPKKYTTTIGNGSLTSITVNHNLGTRNVTVAVYTNSGSYDEVQCDVQHTDSNNVTLLFSVAPITNQYAVVVMG